MNNNKEKFLSTLYKDMHMKDGVAHSSNVSDKKSEEFTDKDMYKQKVNDSKMLTCIYTKYKHNKELTKEDLKFIYEVDSKIEDFGLEDDSRIEEIKEHRDKRKDYACIYECKKEEIGFTISDLKNNKIKYYIGDLDLDGDQLEEIHELPEVVFGDLYLFGVKEVKNVVFPKKIHRLYMENLESLEGVALPKEVGVLKLNGLKKVKNVVWPETVSILSMNSLESLEGVTLPKEVRSLRLNSIKEAKGVVFPKKMETLLMDRLESLEGVTLPKEVRSLGLNGVKEAKGVVFPKKMETLSMNRLESLVGVTLPEEVEHLQLFTIKINHRI